MINQNFYLMLLKRDKAQGTSDKEQGASDKEQGTSDKAQEPEAKKDEQQSLQPAAGDQQPITSNENGRIKASPLAKKLAAEKGIDLRNVHGTGDGGRITKEDIDNYKPQVEVQKPSQRGAEAPRYLPSAPVGEESFEEVPVSQMRKAIAKRLAESKFTAPHFYLTMSIDMDKAVDSRARLNETSPVKISFNDIVLKACADHGDQAGFDRSVTAARGKLAQLTPWLKQYAIRATGNSHIDMAWLWPWRMACLFRL